MISTAFVDQNKQNLDDLVTKVIRFCPSVTPLGQAPNLENAIKLIEETTPDLLFLGLDSSIKFKDILFKHVDSVNFETIISSPSEKLAVEALKFRAVGFLLLPINIENLLITINNAKLKIAEKKEWWRDKALLEIFKKRNLSDEIVGVPTMEGFEFLRIGDIIRCEGLQKCTKVITKSKKNIVSSYNLGEFRKMLEPFGFYLPHKSYLINLYQIVKYHKEGSIVMTDGKGVPVAKRRKSDFLKQLRHL